jgi:hypothetical protein
MTYSGYDRDVRIKMLAPEDIASQLDVPLATVVEWMDSGELPFITLKGEKCVLTPAFERFEERYRTGITIEEQAARDIGEGPVVEHEGAFEPLEGLDLPRD